MIALGFTAPLTPDNLLGHLAATAVPGVEAWQDGALWRSLPEGVVALRWRGDHVALDGPPEAEAVCRAWLDLDADPRAVDAVLAADPLLAPLVAAAPGRRVPRAVDGAEMALRAVLGQQVSTAGARTIAGRLVAELGPPTGHEVVPRRWPRPEALATLDPDALPMPRARGRAFVGLARALADGHPLDRLTDLPGIGPWTQATVAMRALGDDDAFLPTDLGVRAAAVRLGIDDVVTRAERWRPVRAYAVQHLWATGEHAVNRMPGSGAPPVPAGARGTGRAGEPHR